MDAPKDGAECQRGRAGRERSSVHDALHGPLSWIERVQRARAFPVAEARMVQAREAGEAGADGFIPKLCSSVLTCGSNVLAAERTKPAMWPAIAGTDL